MKIYVCTVGTGTAGKHSNVAEGIMAAVRLASPDLLVLIPSSSENSIAVAELVAEGSPGIQNEIHTLSDADNLEQSRKEISEILRRFKKQGEVVLNPTSGTKQMTTSAVLAALDVEIELIEYITGPRQDGVIITGKEEIQKLYARKFIAEKYFNQSLTLLKSDACKAAAMVIEPYKDLYSELYNAAMMFYHWRRFNYSEALTYASVSDGGQWQKVRSVLTELRNSDTLSLNRIADIANYVWIRIEIGDNEEALAVIYRLVEMAAKFRLKEMHIDTENLDDFAAITGHPDLSLSTSVRSQLDSMGKHGNYHLGLRLSLEILDSTDFPFCRMFMKNKHVWSILQHRNRTRYGHGTAFIDGKSVLKLYDTFQSATIEEWAEYRSLKDKYAYPQIEKLLNS